MAEDLLGERQLTDAERREIRRIALAQGPSAINAFTAVCPNHDVSPEGTVTPAFEVLRTDRTFLALARTLCDQTILWLRTEGEVEDREIVKFAYDLPWAGGQDHFGLASFGLAPFIFEFATPHVGATGSYHLHLETPAPLQALTAELVLFDRSDRGDFDEAIAPERVRYKATPGHRVQAADDDFEAFADASGPSAKFYVSGNRVGLEGRVYVSVKLQVGGFLRSASLGCLLIAAVIGTFAWKHHLAMKNNNSAVAVLVIVPALLAYLLRPSEHVLVSGLLAGLRRLVILGGVWPLLAAVLTVVVADGQVLQWSLGGLAVLEALTGFALVAPLLWPPKAEA
ncbi:MAG: hypothetical protein WAU42_01875 [Solirubrobacteraceae bacterium]